MKTYLVPTDFSKSSENALHFAILLAKKQRAKLLLYHSVQTPNTAFGAPPDLFYQQQDAIRQQAENDMRSQCIKIDHATGIPYETLITEGPSAENILQVAKEKKVQMVILGTKGSRSMRDEVFGGTAAKVTEKSDCPVLALPENSDFAHPIKKITFATNYLKSDLRVLSNLVELAATFHAQLNVLHAYPENISADEEIKMMKEFMEKVIQQIAYNNLSFQIIHGNKTEYLLENYIREESTDMLVVSTHYRNFMDRLFKTSLTRKLSAKTSIPILAFHHGLEATEEEQDQRAMVGF